VLGAFFRRFIARTQIGGAEPTLSRQHRGAPHMKFVES
jgi:hypothetical protein